MPIKKKAASKKVAKKSATKTVTKSKALPFVIKPKFLQVTLGGQPFTLDSTHPTFNRLRAALRAKKWKAVPRLVTLARNLFSASQGNVEVRNGVVFYKGTAVDSSLTQRIVDMVKGKKDINHMLRFMDDLYKNPSPEARREFFDWLRENDLPITDSGAIIAYKSVNSDLRDEYTGTIDNSPGQRILGSRKWFDTDYRTQCSTGYHVCSKQYGLYGSRVMAVLVRPRDVLSAVDGKMRVVNYEVLRELGSKTESLFKQEGFTELEKQLVVEIKAERKELIQMLLKSDVVKRLIRRKKIGKTSIQKATYARLKTMVQKYGLLPETKPEPKADVPYLQEARKAAGLTVGQIAKKLKISYKTVSLLEKKIDPERSKADNFIAAIGDLTHVRAVTFPQPMAQ